jgi:hypothetical protein
LAFGYSGVSAIEHHNPKEHTMNAKLTFVKDNIASAAVLAATLIAFAGAAFGPPEVTAKPTETVQMDTIVVTAQRMPTIEMDKIVVVASRAN